MHVKHLAHSSAAVVAVKSSHAPAKSNSYMGLPMLALSGSTLSIALPEMGSFVRPLLLTAPVLGALKKRLPERELSVASMMAVKRPMMMGSEKKTSRSAAASGPPVLLEAAPGAADGGDTPQPGPGGCLRCLN